MPVYTKTQLLVIFIFLALLLHFLYKFKYYNYRQRAFVIFGFYVVVVVTKILDTIYLFNFTYAESGISAIYYALPLYSCDIGLIMGIVMLFLHLKNPYKSYDTVDKFIIYMMLFNSVIPFLFVDFYFGENIGKTFSTVIEVLNAPVANIFDLDNAIAHSIYLVTPLLYARFTNMFKKTYKGFWKSLVIYAGIVIVVHIINLILNAFGLKADYMYTTNSLNEFLPVLQLVFGEGLGYRISKLFTAPILENLIGALLIYYAGISVIYLIHIFVYKYNKKMGYDNLFYNNLINRYDSIV